MSRHFWPGLSLTVLAAGIPLGEGVALVGSLGAALCLGVRWRSVSLPWYGPEPTAASLRALTTFCAAGLLAGAQAGYGSLVCAESMRYAPYLLLPLVCATANLLPTRWLVRAATAFVVSLTIAAAFGLLCVAVDVQPGELMLRPSALAASQGRIPNSMRAAAGGTYFHRLKMAHVLLVGIAALVARQAWLPLAAPRRLVELVALAVQAACLALTYTRAASCAAIAAALACVAAVPQRRRTLARVLVGTIVAAGLLVQLPGVQGRLAALSVAKTRSERGLIWGQAVQVLSDHPFGVGLGHYPAAIARYYDLADPLTASPRTYPHNILLAAWAEAGPLGLAAFVTLWLCWMRTCLLTLQGGSTSGRAEEEGGPCAARRAVAAAGFGGGVALWLVGLTHDVLFHSVVAQAYVGLMAWTLSMLRHLSPERRGHRPWPP